MEQVSERATASEFAKSTVIRMDNGVGADVTIRHRTSSLVACVLTTMLAASCGGSSTPKSGLRIGITEASEGSLYSGPATISGDAPDPDFDRGSRDTEAFVLGRVVAIGRAHLNTTTGDLVLADSPRGFMPFTTMSVRIDRTLFERPGSRLAATLTVGSVIDVEVAGGKVVIVMDGRTAATMFLINSKGDGAAHGEPTATVKPDDRVDITIAFDSGLNVAVGDEVVAGLTLANVEWLRPGGHSEVRQVQSLADRGASLFRSREGVLETASTSPVKGAPRTLDELVQRARNPER